MAEEGIVTEGTVGTGTGSSDNDDGYVGFVEKAKGIADADVQDAINEAMADPSYMNVNHPGHCRSKRLGHCTKGSTPSSEI